MPNPTKHTTLMTAVAVTFLRAGLSLGRNMVSWNSSHGSAGCGEADLPKTGGAGLLDCFAVK